MPGIVAHMSVAKMVGEKLGITDLDFYRGNLLPDILKGDKMDTHYKVQGKVFHIPDCDYYRNHFDLSNSLFLGYYTHLLLDYYFMDDFIPGITTNRDIFHDKIIYEDYDKSNQTLIQYFGLDVKELLSILVFDGEEIDSKRLKTNLECLQKSKEGETQVIPIDEFILFLEESASLIVQEIKKDKQYQLL